MNQNHSRRLVTDLHQQCYATVAVALDPATHQDCKGSLGKWVSDISTICRKALPLSKSREFLPSWKDV